MAKKAKTQEQIQAEVKKMIAARNKEFRSADAAGKRVLIAQDVLAQIRAKKFQPESSTWLNVRPENYDEYDYCADPGLAPTESLQEVILDKNRGETCSGCALGGLFLSCTLYNNNVTGATLENETCKFNRLLERAKDVTFANKLNKYFSLGQLSLIEYMFEGGFGSITLNEDNGWLDEDEKEERDSLYHPDVIKFHKKHNHDVIRWNEYYSDEDRLVAIMKNIVKNNGTFKPENILKSFHRKLARA